MDQVPRLACHLVEQAEGGFVGLAGEVAIQRFAEGGLFGCDCVEESDGGAELEVVGIAEDAVDARVGWGRVDEGRALAEAWAEYGMGDVGQGFVTA